ncbi:MFS transporter [Oleiagrimonas sp. C23AA]|uniref:MFS transporter n=1 Tax=Oleiagrimonas sp. C23AA TaxID=2719047 RepID=UPI00142163ED|nr:MFS transporter [Oleiagrimonas sp. C23AA]NII11224.1 SLC45 family MFS transporter [Oleiagrimonas sp. C23AA]
MSRKPELSFWQIWNMCFGFLGIQFGFALQNANVSRIFQTLGAPMDSIAGLWVAAPLTGLIVQPLIGHYSDRTWTRLGRRRPYFLAGAVLTTLALFAMPNAPYLWVAAGTLWVMDASINVSMEPFRAFVGDQLPTRQRSLGYLMQSFFIGIGAVVASALPWLLAQAGVANTAAPGHVPDTVRYAFYLGGAVLFLSVLWTVLSSREYSPPQLAAFDDATPVAAREASSPKALPRRGSLIWLILGLALALLVAFTGLERELYILAGMLVAYGLAQLWAGRTQSQNALAQILGDLHHMPQAMRRLAWVQFFSWFAMFAMWIYTTPAVTAVQYHTSDTASAAYNEGANWVGVLFAVYSAFAAVAALVIPWMVRRLGLRKSHLVNLFLGGAGLASFALIANPHWLLVSMVGVGFAWASILSLPYALLSDHLPAQKMGVYMGIFNFFIVIPQLLAASILGLLLRTLFGDQPIYALVLGGVSLVTAGLFTLRVSEPATT